jgi:DNA-binding LacI/PurR family transcriptional regulator
MSNDSRQFSRTGDDMAPLKKDANDHGKRDKLQMVDIARLANVSVATVSRTLSNHPKVSPETRSRVLELVKTLNYSVNAGARIMRGKALHTVAVAFPYHPAQRRHFKDPFFLELVGSIGDALVDRGYSMLLTGVLEENRHELTQPYDTGQAVGTILLGQEGNHRWYNELALRDMPFVVWGAHLADQLYCTVGSDNVDGGKQATRYLLSQGCRRIAFFGDRNLAEIGLRYRGYVEALEEGWLPVDEQLYIPTPFVNAEIRRHTHALVDSGLPFDAIFASSDVMAINIISVLQERGIDVPGKVRVVGFDDISVASSFSPPITTVRQSIEAAGKALVERLMAKAAGESATSVILPTELIIRASA